MRWLFKVEINLLLVSLVRYIIIKIYIYIYIFANSLFYTTLWLVIIKVQVYVDLRIEVGRTICFKFNAGLNYI